MNQPYEEAFNAYLQVLNLNMSKIRDKYRHPNTIIKLEDSSSYLNIVNGVIAQANAIIEEFNKRVSEISRELSVIKNKFWNILREEYSQSIAEYINKKKIFEHKNAHFESSEKRHKAKQEEIKLLIANEQKNIINIEDAISNINSMLTDMGITDFSIVKSHPEEGLYRIVRENDNKSIFKTLSEGERTIISILYFIETCKGLIDKSSTNKKRIVVIDDPVSSLSNIYVFNIGRLLRNLFYPEVKQDRESDQLIIKPKFEQVFILTHSLYFFYEMTEMAENKRHATQSLFRVSKNEDGSKIEIMHYEHIQSDYQTYWMTIRDSNVHPALIANCMRNIIEYFFNFVEKRDLNNVFNQDIFKRPNYQAFYRYINRESHSLGQNIYDFKDFDYQTFMDALKNVFKIMGYEKHYKKMMKIK